VKFSFFQLCGFRVDNARVFQRVSINLNMTVGQAAYRLFIIMSTYSMHVGCVLYLLNCTDCCVWIRRKNLWLFVFEMYLIKA